MNRRDAIKNISLGLGYAISSTTILQVFNSCSGSKKNDIYFFNRKELYVINNLVEIIIPNSEKNTVMDLFLSKFTDKMLINTNSPEEQQIFRLGAEAFINKFELLYNKDAKKGFPKEYKHLIDQYFNITPKETSDILELINRNESKIPNNRKELYYIYNFLYISRKHILLGYYTSKKIMEDVFNYQSISDRYKGCIDI